MRTVGQILREARESKLLTLDDVEKATKIRKELILALEGSDYKILPPPTFVQGFIKNYGKFLGLDAEKLLAVFRRDFESKKHPPHVLETFANPLGKPKLRVTPHQVLWVLLGFLVVGFFAYLWVEYRQFVGEPMLVLTSPAEGQSVAIPTVRVEGQTDPEVKVTVNNQEIAVDKDGKFGEEISLSSSVNKIVVTSSGKFGRTATIERTVFVGK